MKPLTAARDFHRNLAKYYDTKPIYMDEPNQKKPNIRKLVELPWHQAKAKLWKNLIKLFTDILYLNARTSICDIWQLLDDYSFLSTFTNSDALKFRDFIAKHAQTLSLHNGQFVALLNHEGFESAYEQIEIIKNNKLVSNGWLYTVNKGRVSETELDRNMRSLKLLSSWKFESRKLVGLACKKKFAFCMSRLGEVEIIDIIKSYPIKQKIAIRRISVLGLFPSEEGKYLAVAYEIGEADVLELGFNDQGLTFQEHSKTFKYKVPQFEAPTMYWDDQQLIYQEDGNCICSLNLISGNKICLINSDNMDFYEELRGAIRLSHVMILVLSTEKRTQLLLLDKGHSRQLCEIENVDTISVCVGGTSIVAACFTNREIRVFNLADIQNEFKYVTITDMPTCMCYYDGALILPTQSDDFYYWHFDKCASPEKLYMPPTKTSDDLQRHISVSGIDTFIVASRTSTSVFTISSQDDRKANTILAFFVSSSNKYAVIKRDQEILLTKINSGAEIRLSENKHRVFCFCIDGYDNFLLACSDGTGIVLDCISENRYPVIGIPLSITCSTGDPNGGFWLADRFGNIHHVGTNGTVELVWSPETYLAHVQELICTKTSLIWRGWTNWTIENGEARPETFIFFETYNHNQLHLKGKRLFFKSEGTIETITYDHFRQLIIVIFQNRLNEKKGISVGSVDGFIAREEVHRAIFGIPNFVKFACCTIVNFIYLLTRDGTINCLDLSNLQQIAVLTPSSPLRLMSFTSDKDGVVLLSDMESRIFTCNIVKSV